MLILVRGMCDVYSRLALDATVLAGVFGAGVGGAGLPLLSLFVVAAVTAH